MKSRSSAAGRDHAYVDLLARSRAAIEKARQTVARSEVLAAAMRLHRDRESLLVRCAWCDRYSLGSEWMRADELPHIFGVGQKLQDERITHSICPECMQAPSSIGDRPHEKGRRR
jgi:hypothetical protein